MRHNQLSMLILCGSIPAAVLACRGGGSDASGGGGSGAATSSPSSTKTSTGTGSTGTQSTVASTGAFGTGSSSSGNGGASSTTGSSTTSSTAASTAASTSATTTSTTSSTSTGMMGGGSTFVVVRVGDGATALSSSAAQVFLEERQLDGALVIAGNNPLPLPTAVSGSNRVCTLSGTAPGEGALSLSADGQFLVLGGYDAAVATANVNNTTVAAVNRIVARVSSAGTIDTSTRIDNAYTQNSIRGATSVDGTAFWTTGGSNGIRYATIGGLGASAIETTPSTARGIHVFGGQLYATSGSGTTKNVFTVGTGTPTTSGQTATPLYPNPSTTSSPYSFAILDRNPNVAGLDTMYVADDRSAALGGGVAKWTFNGATWSAGPIFADGVGTAGVLGLTALVTGANVTLVATTGEVSLNRIIVYVDDGVTTNPTGTVIATAATNTIFRGVAPAPQ